MQVFSSWSPMVTSMSEENTENRIEEIKEMGGGPGVEEVLEAYDGESGYVRDDSTGENYVAAPDNKASYSDSSA